MKYSKSLQACLLGTSVLLAGCSSLNSTFNSVTQPLQVVAPQTNNTILSQFIVLNQSEVAMGKLAMTKAHHRMVKRYAAEIRHDHSQAVHAAMHFSKKSGIEPVTNVTSDNLQNHANQEMDTLKTLSGNAFDKAFIEDAIADHKAALNLLDEDIKLSTDPKLTKLLKGARPVVKHHLVQAEHIQKVLDR